MLRSKEYEEKWVRIGKKRQFVPKYSEWEKKCSCIGCNVAYFPSIDQYYCNQWECKFTYIIYVMISFIFAMATGIWLIFDCFTGLPLKIILGCFCLISMIWFISYFCAVFRSPGYLPFYWAVEKGIDYSYEEQMCGIITNEEQYLFASLNERPERGSLSKQARRIVLRADHICVWISNWVGLKNYRYFFTKLVWTLILFAFWFIIFGYKVFRLFKYGFVFTIPLIITFVVLIPIVLLFIFFMNVFLNHFRYLTTNNTTLYEMKNPDSSTSPYNVGCFQNCVETLGPAEYCPIWFCPCPLPRTNDGLFWKKNDQSDPNKIIDIEKAAEYERQPVVYAPEEEESYEEIEDSPLLGQLPSSNDIFRINTNNVSSILVSNFQGTNFGRKRSGSTQSRKKMRKFDKDKDAGRKTYIRVKKHRNGLAPNASTPTLPKLESNSRSLKRNDSMPSFKPGFNIPDFSKEGPGEMV